MKSYYALLALMLCFYLASVHAESNDFVLNIFGNANIDSTIDDKDIEYIQAVIDGKETPTSLSDANNDGTIDENDISQVKKIIDGKEEELIVIDSANRTVSLKTPIERVVIARKGPEEFTIILAKDKIIGIGDDAKVNNPDIVQKTGVDKIPGVGNFNSGSLDYEAIISLNPDLILATTPSLKKGLADKLPDNIPILALDCEVDPNLASQNEVIKKLGYIVNQPEKADKLINWRNKYENILVDEVNKLDQQTLPTYYIETYDKYVTYLSDLYDSKAISGCGGRNIVDGSKFLKNELGNEEVIIDPEWLIDQNPDFIFLRENTNSAGFSWTDEEAKKELETLIDRPGWENLKAVKNGHVYLYDKCFVRSRSEIGKVYFAKWMHPDLFQDLDPSAIHADYWKEFINEDLAGLWVYPEPK
jgi:iron complex transport system substrate-binding protein